MNRRQFLSIGVAVAAGVVTADSLTGLSGLSEIEPAAAWPRGCIDHLPKSENRRMAWTVDDGASTHALRGYIDMLELHPEIRMTMFVLGGASSWKKLARPISELAATGQLQLANHTMHHHDMTKLSRAHIKQELVLTSRFIEDHFGVDAGPYWRPPYGYIDNHLIRVAHDLGYTKPVLWFGSTASNAGVSSATVWSNCKKWMTNGRIVIDHANSDSTVANFGKIRGLLASRGLDTVTLNDVFG
ncbi:MAG: polysaccharide deacetylase family protein [Microbacteriaceae bacterium]